MDYNGYESGEGRGKRKQHCTYCKNHGKKSRKTNHKCDFETCECLLCKLTRLSRLIMRHQQRLWRHLKDSKRRESAAEFGGGAGGAAGGGGAGGVSVGGGAPNGVATSDPTTATNGGSTKQQKCDMCRNHGEITSKRAHKNACPYQNCTCALCNLTRKRRDIMRHQQRVRRSQVTSQQHNEAWEYVIQATAELELLNKSNHAIIPSITTTSSNTTITSSSSSSFTSASSSSLSSSSCSNSSSSSSSNSSASSSSSFNHDNHPASSSASCSSSPVPSLVSGSISFKSEVIHSASTPPTPVANGNKNVSSISSEMPPLEPLENSSPVTYSPGPLELASSANVTPVNPLTPTDPVHHNIGIKDLHLMENEYPWKSMKREREELFRWNSKHQRDDLFWNLDFMRGHEALTRRLEPSVPMEGINFHDSVNGMDFVSSHDSPFKSLAPMIEASRLPPTPLKKTRTDENFRYNPMFWGNSSLEPRLGYGPEELQQQCYRRVLMSASSPDLRMRTPPALIPIPQPQPPLRPRPLAPLRSHAFPSGMDWDHHVNLQYLAYFLQSRGVPYSEAMATAAPFGLTRDAPFFNTAMP